MPSVGACPNEGSPGEQQHRVPSGGGLRALLRRSFIGMFEESNTHGVGLFAVKDMKTGDSTDIDCFGTFVLYYTKTEVHGAIAADGVPRYMVASMCVGGEVLCRTPHYF
ncbi:unnamed protein product [Ascophyllum nodosum]